jgi:hypothetical protein
MDEQAPDRPRLTIEELRALPLAAAIAYMEACIAAKLEHAMQSILINLSLS